MPLRFGLPFPTLIAFAFASCPSLAQDEIDVVPTDTFIMPVPIERAPPPYPPNEEYQNREGWVILSYIITPEGGIAEPMIEDSSGGEAFEKAALRALSRWRYSPATVGGEPVEQSMTKVRLVFQLEGSQGARSRFIRTYREAATLISSGDFAAALPLPRRVRNQFGVSLLVLVPFAHRRAPGSMAGAWRERRGTVVDPFGHIWLLATKLEDVNRAEMAERFKRLGG